MTLNTADAVYLGGTLADAVYLGDTLVWSAVTYDPDTEAFLDATGLNDSYAPALDGLVLGLKQHGLWTKMNAIYPFIGGTKDLHKWNLKDPRDADAAYRLTYSTPDYGTHSDAGGYQPNLAPDTTVGYADTHLIPQGTLDPASCHLSLFSLGPLPNAPRCDFGAYNWDGAQKRFHLICHYTSGEFYYSLGHAGVPAVGQPGSGDGSGMFVSSRDAINNETAYRNGAMVGNNGNAGGLLPPLSLLIGTLQSYPREGSEMKMGFVSIGAGLTAQDVANLTNVVQNYQAALGRIAWDPTMLLGLTLWLDASKLPLVDGQPVTIWPDGSSYRTDLTVWDGASSGFPGTAPVLRTNAANGRPAVHFNGTSNALATQVQPPTYKHAFIVAKNRLATFPDYNGLFTGYDGNEILFIGNGPGSTRWYLPPWGGDYRFNGLWSSTWPGPMGAYGLMDLAGSYSLVRTVIGMDRQYPPRWWDGDVAEVITYDRILSEPERLQVQEYLSDKYGLFGVFSEGEG